MPNKSRCWTRKIIKSIKVIYNIFQNVYIIFGNNNADTSMRIQKGWWWESTIHDNQIQGNTGKNDDWNHSLLVCPTLWALQSKLITIRSLLGANKLMHTFYLWLKKDKADLYCPRKNQWGQSKHKDNRPYCESQSNITVHTGNDMTLMEWSQHIKKDFG
jgi:hypothetical protein